jgi:hypothetical protein
MKPTHNAACAISRRFPSPEMNSRYINADDEGNVKISRKTYVHPKALPYLGGKTTIRVNQTLNKLIKE